MKQGQRASDVKAEADARAEATVASNAVILYRRLKYTLQPEASATSRNVTEFQHIMPLHR